MKKGYPQVLLMALCLLVIITMLPLMAACGGGSSTKQLKVGMIIPATGTAAADQAPGCRRTDGLHPA